MVAALIACSSGVALLDSGTVRPVDLITHRLPLDAALSGFEAMRQRTAVCSSLRRLHDLAALTRDEMWLAYTKTTKVDWHHHVV